MNNNKEIDLNNINTSPAQQEFEDNMLSLDDTVYRIKCTKCGKLTVDECTVDYCEEPTCSFDQLGDLFHSPGYQELMFDDKGNPIKNFLGKEK